MTPENPEFAAWRVWAAEVRDRRGAYRYARLENAEQGRLLCRLLDSWQECDRRARRPGSARNLAKGLQEGIALLVGQMLLNGIRPPHLPARPPGAR